VRAAAGLPLPLPPPPRLHTLTPTAACCDPDALPASCTLCSPMLQFPYGWAPSEMFYNMPQLGSSPLRLDACAVAGILTGDVRAWDDPALQELNPEVHPHLAACPSAQVHAGPLLSRLAPRELPVSCREAHPPPRPRLPPHSQSCCPLLCCGQHTTAFPRAPHQAELPDLPLTLVYLNLSMPITQTLTQWLAAECPAWTVGVTDNLQDVVAALGDGEESCSLGPACPCWHGGAEGCVAQPELQGRVHARRRAVPATPSCCTPAADLIASTDVEGTWRAVNATPGAIAIGGSMPVGQYVATYPDAMQYAVVRNAAGDFVAPNGDLNASAVAALAAGAPSPADPAQDWSQLYAQPPSRYPILYWGMMTAPRDLTADGPRGHYIKDAGRRIFAPALSVLMLGTRGLCGGARHSCPYSPAWPRRRPLRSGLPAHSRGPGHGGRHQRAPAACGAAACSPAVLVQVSCGTGAAGLAATAASKHCRLSCRPACPATCQAAASDSCESALLPPCPVAASRSVTTALLPAYRPQPALQHPRPPQAPPAATCAVGFPWLHCFLLPSPLLRF
jgi:hypothetical protein